MKKLLAAAGLSLAVSASPAYAAASLTPVMEAVTPPPVFAPCDDPSIAIGAQDCAGYYAGNMFNNSNFAEQQAAIATLEYMGMNYPYNGTWQDLVDNGQVIFSLSGDNNNELNFSQTLYGVTVVGAHFGASLLGQQQNVSVFWLFDFGNEGADSVALNGDLDGLNINAFSNGTLYLTGTPSVPEPGTWLMLLLGFAGIGFTLRRGKGASTAGELEGLRLLAK